VKALCEYRIAVRNKSASRSTSQRLSAIRTGCAVLLLAVAAIFWAGAALMVNAASARVKTASQSSTQAKGQSGNAENGKRLFTKYGCYQCHGLAAQGSTVTGPRLGPTPPPLQVLVMYLRNPTGEMPPYTKKVVSDQDIADIHAFLESLPHPHDAKTNPLLNK
jgi:mono/diheme cytochrome c family protein